MQPSIPTSIYGDTTYAGMRSWDKVAYVETGKPYGLIGIDRVTEPSGYSYYMAYEWERQNFEMELNSYNARCSRGTFYAGSSEARMCQQQYNSLITKQKKLGARFWNELGIVNRIEIWW
jgi:hypothetical protein